MPGYLEINYKFNENNDIIINCFKFRSNILPYLKYVH